MRLPPAVLPHIAAYTSEMNEMSSLSPPRNAPATSLESLAGIIDELNDDFSYLRACSEKVNGQSVEGLRDAILHMEVALEMTQQAFLRAATCFAKHAKAHPDDEQCRALATFFAVADGNLTMIPAARDAVGGFSLGR